MAFTLKVMGGTGDTRITFDERDRTAEATLEAKALFDRLTKTGRKAFRVNAGEKDGPVTKFSDVEGEVILVGRIAGG